MKAFVSELVVGALLCSSLAAGAVTRYVDLNSPSPTAPFTTWATAATNIQDAIDTANDGDLVLVTNGVYRSGGRVVYDSLTNRVAVVKALNLASANGPNVTFIEGYQLPGSVNGDGAIRCIYLTNGASLTGFTLTNGATRGDSASYFASRGGAIWCETNSNIVISNCLLIGNSSSEAGGGVYRGTLIRCSLTRNTSQYGGAASGSSLHNCQVIDNSAFRGGGTYNSTVRNSLIQGNYAVQLAGGSYFGNLQNCMIVANRANSGGGIIAATVHNSVVYYNSAQTDPNYNISGEPQGVMNYCCTTPSPNSGTGNFTEAPQLSSPSHLSPNSPCRNAGDVTYISGVDIDGEVWRTPPSIGCDEYHPGGALGPLSVAISVDATNIALGYEATFSAAIIGPVTESYWDFDDGTTITNQPFVTHTWGQIGHYSVKLVAMSDSHPSGVIATQIIHVAAAPIHYVALTSTNPTPPFDSWATAATNIQAAVDAAFLGGTVIVSNGVYETGGMVVGQLSNRVAITKPLSLLSVNGPESTVIRGYQNAISTNGNDAVRCIYLANGTTLVGFTLKSGATRTTGNSASDISGGGIWCESGNVSISNCIVSGNTSFGSGGGIYQGTVYRCTISNNAVISPFSSQNGGGAYNADLHRSLLRDNRANYGGGAAYGTLSNCVVSSNHALTGGGTYSASLINCALYGNKASDSGGAYLWFNSALNCTIVGNYAASSGGGISGSYSSITNSVIHGNLAGESDNHISSSTVFDHCCADPLPDGEGNINITPAIADGAHLAQGSPCIGAGNPNAPVGVDIDGEMWASPPSIGCDEFSSVANGPLQLSISLLSTNLLPGWPVQLLATIDGHATSNHWDFGDGSAATNTLAIRRVWTAPGIYPVVLSAFNSSNPSGVSVTSLIHILERPVHYVSLASTNPTPPYTNWSTAAKDIQSAVDVAGTGALVLVTNGVYESGGRRVSPSPTTNRVVITGLITVQSVNGPEVTFIKGTRVPGTTNGINAVRCVYLGTRATLSGFTLTNGATRSATLYFNDRDGGGALCESSLAVITNCTIVGNNAANNGGGVYGGTLTSCLIKGNTANSGGGASSSLLNFCILTGNQSYNTGGGVAGGTAHSCTFSNNVAKSGGGAANAILNNCLLRGNDRTQSGSGAGAYGGTLNNCTLVENYAEGASWATLNNCIAYNNDGDNHSFSTLNNCCTYPAPPSGTGNITNAPLFVNPGAGDYHLQADSPCINGGNNAYVTGNTDLAGGARIAGGTVDIGAYEYQSPLSMLPYAWLQQYGLPTDGSADYADTDGDGMNTYGEWRSDTAPTSALSVLKMVNATNSPDGAIVNWESVSTRSYWLERAINLDVGAPFEVIAWNIPGVAGTNSYIDSTVTNGGSYFYRVGVQ